MFFSLLLTAALGAHQVAADLSCTNYVPKGTTSSNGLIHVDTGSQDDPGTVSFSNTPQPLLTDQYRPIPGVIPTYASVGNPWKLRSQKNPGATFHFLTCNSTSLGLSSSEQESCSDGGCYKAYSDYIQIVNPYTGHCLTMQQWNVSSTELDFVACDPNPKDSRQLWLAGRYVDYSQGFGSITGYEPITLDVVQRTDSNGELEYPFFAWYISPADNKTIEVIQYQYTQDKIFMTLKV